MTPVGGWITEEQLLARQCSGAGQVRVEIACFGAILVSASGPVGTKPGCRAEFVELFTSRGGPAQREYGMTVLGPLLDTEDPDALVWVRAFPTAEERESIKTAFYDGPAWSQELEGLILPLLADYSSVRVCSLPDGFLDGPLRSQDWR